MSRPLWSDGFIGGRAVRLGRTPDRTARAVRHPIGRAAPSAPDRTAQIGRPAASRPPARSDGLQIGRPQIGRPQIGRPPDRTAPRSDDRILTKNHEKRSI